MKRLALIALALAACIPDPGPAAVCTLGLRRCSAVGTPLLCNGARWVADRTTSALDCGR